MVRRSGASTEGMAGVTREPVVARLSTVLPSFMPRIRIGKMYLPAGAPVIVTRKVSAV